MKRKTFAKEFIIEGKGLHKGNYNLLIVKPYYGKGIVFKNPDNGKTVLADLDNVVSTLRGTTVGFDGFEVSTVEHLLSCFFAFDVDDAEIEIKGDEVPSLDGSASLLTSVMEKVGVIEKDEDCDVAEIEEGFCYVAGESFYKVDRAEGFFVECIFENGHPLVGRQSFAFEFNKDRYVNEIAPARTFAFEDEIEYLRKNNLALGGSLENAVVIGKDKILNEDGLRFPDEFVRHKILDLLGDLKLINARLKNMKIVAKRPSHKENINFAKLLRIRGVYERKNKNSSSRGYNKDNPA